MRDSAVVVRPPTSVGESQSGDPGAEPGTESATRVVAFLQPIVSVREREVKLVEALARGVDAAGRLVAPLELFSEALRLGRRSELEQDCRRAGFRAYHLARRSGFEPVLSLNADTSLVRAGADGAARLLDEVSAASLSPSSIAVEILESAFHDSERLEQFTRTVRQAGFLVALDDVGTGHSNLERIPRLEPDILKIDRSLVHGMHESFHRREVVRALVSLSHQIGAVVIAEGIEEEEDAFSALSLGCDLFQGFYFGVPRDPTDGEPLYDEARLRTVGHRLRDGARLRLSERRAHQRTSDEALGRLVSLLAPLREAEFESVISDALSKGLFFEAIYVLDERGKQLTDTVHRATSARRERQALFRPATRGADQSLKHYFVMLDAGLEKFTSDPYISSASGNYCITMSRYFESVLGRRYVLCCDMLVSEHP